MKKITSSSITTDDVRRDIKLLDVLTPKKRVQVVSVLMNRLKRALTKHYKEIEIDYDDERLAKKMSEPSPEEKLHCQKYALEVVIVGAVKELYLRGLDNLECKKYIHNRMARIIGLSARDIIAKSTGLQTVSSAEMCKDTSIPWTDHSTFEHWYPAQWAGTNLFLAELEGNHKPGEIFEKLERFRETVIALKDENRITLKPFQGANVFTGCPRKCYSDAKLKLVPQVKLPSGKKKKG